MAGTQRGYDAYASMLQEKRDKGDLESVCAFLRACSAILIRMDRPKDALPLLLEAWDIAEQSKWLEKDESFLTLDQLVFAYTLLCDTSGLAAVEARVVENRTVDLWRYWNGWWLWEAARARDEPRVAHLLARPSIDLNVGNNANICAMHWAAKYCSVSLTRRMVEAGARINVCTAQGTTPLAMAVTAGNLEVVSFLVEHGASMRGTVPATVRGAVAEGRMRKAVPWSVQRAYCVLHMLGECEVDSAVEREAGQRAYRAWVDSWA